MVKGIYSAASGMLAESIRTDAIANNLANVNTTGYKKDIAVNQSFREMLLHKIEGLETPQPIGSIGTGVDVTEIKPIIQTGPHHLTGHNLDIALEGNGFFVIDTPAGQRYTRDGAFVLNEENYLVTVNGHFVLGQDGPIRFDPATANRIDIGTNGVITAAGQQVGQLMVVDFENPQAISKEGSSLWVAREDPLLAQAKVVQGSLECSNVNAVSEMVDLITATRAYEMNQKMIQMQDATLDKAINEVGKR